MKLKMNCIHKCYLRLRLTPVTSVDVGQKELPPVPELEVSLLPVLHQRARAGLRS